MALEDTLLWQNLRVRKGRAFHGGGSFGHRDQLLWHSVAAVGTGLASVVGKARRFGHGAMWSTSPSERKVKRKLCI